MLYKDNTTNNRETKYKENQKRLIDNKRFLLLILIYFLNNQPLIESKDHISILNIFLSIILVLLLIISYFMVFKIGGNIISILVSILLGPLYFIIFIILLCMGELTDYEKCGIISSLSKFCLFINTILSILSILNLLNVFVFLDYSGFGICVTLNILICILFYMYTKYK